MNELWDVAAYVWPSYTGDEPRTRGFWPEGNGEWQTVQSATSGDNPQLRQPLWGYCNEADPKVMEMQISEALKHGVNTFIYDWYWYDGRPFLEQCLNNGFLGAKNNEQMNFYLMWANHDVGNVWDKRIAHYEDNVIWRGALFDNEFNRMTERVIEKFFTKPNYYQIAGSPVFAIYELANFLAGFDNLEEAKDGILSFRERTKARGFNGLNLQLIVWALTDFEVVKNGVKIKMPVNEIANFLGFDSVTHYQYVHFAKLNRDYSEIMVDVVKEWHLISEKFEATYFPHVSIGWDNQIRYSVKRDSTAPENSEIFNNPPAEIESALRAAKQFLIEKEVNPKLVTINSWNEWTECSYLEPDHLHGYGYLEAVARTFTDQSG